MNVIFPPTINIITLTGQFCKLQCQHSWLRRAWFLIPNLTTLQTYSTQFKANGSTQQANTRYTSSQTNQHEETDLPGAARFCARFWAAVLVLFLGVAEAGVAPLASMSCCCNLANWSSKSFNLFSLPSSYKIQPGMMHLSVIATATGWDDNSNLSAVVRYNQAVCRLLHSTAAWA